MTTTSTLCAVCTEELSADASAICNFCGSEYHLRQKENEPGKDCGQVWINEDHLGLEFACDPCLNPPAPDSAALDDIVTVEEASALAGKSEQSLVEAAEAGLIRHRKTAGGVYLFERGEVLLYASRQA